MVGIGRLQVIVSGVVLAISLSLLAVRKADAQAYSSKGTEVSAPQIQLDVIIMQMPHRVAKQLFPLMLKNAEHLNLTTGHAFPPFQGVARSNEDLQGVLEVLKQEGLLKLLAEPSLVTLIGRPACFLLGYNPGGISPQQALDLQQTVDDDWCPPSAQSLKVVPTLLSKGKIHLEIELLDRRQAPACSERIKTAVNLKDEQTAVIGGSVHTVTQEADSSIPLLGQLPIVGPMLRCRKKEQKEEEVVMLITPFLVKETQTQATNPQAVAKRRNQLERHLQRRLQDAKVIRRQLHSLPQDSASSSNKP